MRTSKSRHAIHSANVACNPLAPLGCGLSGLPPHLPCQEQGCAATAQCFPGRNFGKADEYSLQQTSRWHLLDEASRELLGMRWPTDLVLPANE